MAVRYWRPAGVEAGSTGVDVSGLCSSGNCTFRLVGAAVFYWERFAGALKVGGPGRLSSVEAGCASPSATVRVGAGGK